MALRIPHKLAGARSFLANLWALARPFWSAQQRQTISLGRLRFSVKESWIARGILALIALLSATTVLMSMLINAWSGRFFTALQEKDAAAFWRELRTWAVLIVFAGVAVVYREWLVLLLTIRWRRWLSQELLKDWLAGRTYYRMELLGLGTDNPEQRIEHDCDSFAHMTVTLLSGLFQQILMLATFVVVLWNLSGTLIVPVLGGIPIPGYMMWAAVLYAVAGSYAAYRIGSPLVRVNFDLERFNADFRYQMGRIRDNAESIALYGGEADEERNLRAAFGRIYDTWWAFMKYSRRLTWLRSFYGQAASIFPVVIASPRYFSGQIAFGVLSQTADAFGQVQLALSWFVDAFSMLATWKAVVDRLTGFREAMNKAKEAAAQETLERRSRAAADLLVEELSVALPDGQPLLEGVNLRIGQGETVVITGASGSGKTTLFRALAGLWPFGKGRVTLPEGARVLFLPQKPYLPLGTFKEVLSYPEPPDRYTDEAAAEVLEAVSLGRLAPRLAESGNWSLMLSGGEQQLVAFARALLHRPGWLFIDEATSALDEAAERRVYNLLKARLPDASLVSVAHKPAVASFHSRRIIVDRASRSVSTDDDRESAPA